MEMSDGIFQLVIKVIFLLSNDYLASVVLLFGNLGFAGVLDKAENIKAIHRHFMMGHTRVSGTHLTCNQSLLRVNKHGILHPCL